MALIFESLLIMFTIQKAIHQKINVSFYVTSIILFLCLLIPNDVYSYLLSFILLISYLTYTKKRIQIKNTLLPIILCVCKVISQFLASQFCVLLMVENLQFIQLIELYFLLALCFVIIYKYSHASIRKYYVYMPFLYVCILMLFTLLPFVFGHLPARPSIYILFIEVILLLICGLILFYLMNKQMNENKRMSSQLAKEELQKNMYNITQRSMNQISSDKHMMIYTLMKINQMLSNNNNQDLTNFLNNEISKYTTYKQITSTGNPLFDYEMTNKINLIASRKIDVKTYMSINERNALLQEESVVYYLLSCIDQMIGFDVPISEMQLFFNEVNSSYLKVRIVLIYWEKIENSVKLANHPLLTKHQQIHDEQYDEFIFLFHTRN